MELFGTYSASTGWWGLIIFGEKKKAKNLMFSAGGISEILVRRKKGRDFNMGISTLQSLLMFYII